MSAPPTQDEGNDEGTHEGQHEARGRAPDAPTSGGGAGSPAAPDRRLSPRSFALGVAVAFAAGLLASLALRPPGSAPERSAEQRAAQDDAPIAWRVPAAFGTNLPALGDNILYVRDALADTTGDGIRLQVFEPGEIVSAFAITEAVRDAKVPAGYTWLGYDQGRVPASTLLGAVPFGMEPWAYTAWWYEGGGRELGEGLYRRRGVHPLLCGLIGPETAGWFRKPIDTLEDLRGLKIRFAGLGGRVLQELGASVTMIPGSALFQALEKGAIDATEYSLPVVDRLLGFDRVAPINYFPGWHQTFTAAHLVVNLDLWEALPERRRHQLEVTCTAGVTRNLAKAEALQGPVISGFEADGVSARRLPRPLLEELRRVTERVLEAEAARDPEFAEILASQRAFTEAHAPWKRLAYLPRDF